MPSFPLYLGFILVLYSTSVYSQDGVRLTIEVPSVTQSEVVPTLTDRDSNALKNDLSYQAINKTDVFNEDWNNTRFKVYEDKKVEYPIQLTFVDSQYASPINREMVVTSRYGRRAGQNHHGIDIDLVTGDLVMAMFSGKVRLVQYVSGMGKTVVIRHANGLETTYGHLSKQFVAENTFVEKGQAIGRGGATGNARGSHLHLEVRYKGRSINPEYLFDFEEQGKINVNPCWISKKWATPGFHKSTRRSVMEIYSPVVVALTVPPAPDPPQQVEVKAKPVLSQPPATRQESPGQDPYELVYVVQPGDTLYSIANRYRLTVRGICEVNGIKDETLIKVGQSLVLGE